LFTTSTTGTIKFIDITFPPGISIGATSQLIEREVIGDGTAAKTSSTQIRFTVTSAASNSMFIMISRLGVRTIRGRHSSNDSTA
jgi:hypothetical protein